MTQPTLTTRLAAREKPRDRSPVMYQSWRHLLFLHWEYPVEAIQATLPPGLHVDIFEGKAYLGIVPFFMQAVRPRFLPAVPGLSNFLETNLRTYVYDDRGVAGVWFYSLDANQWLAVKIARTLFQLPYYYAKMAATVTPPGPEVTYTTWRRGAAPTTESRFRYRAAGPTRHAEPGSLEFFLLERYILFAYNPRRRSLSTGQVYHTPYPFVEATVSEWDDHILPLDDFPSPARPPDSLLVSPGVDVNIYGLQRVAA